MPTRHRTRAPSLPRPQHPRRTPPRGNPLFGYGYNPSWPSIVSVAHDEADGAGLFVITDRPCVLAGPTLPLTLPEAPPMAIVGAATVLSVKFRLQMTTGVPRGTAWQWGAGACQLTDAHGGHVPNVGAGDCADVPGPYTPPPPAVVTSAWASGNEAHLFFGQYLVLSGTPAADGAFTFDGFTPTTVSRPGPYELAFTCPNLLTMGSTWAANVQPGWLATVLEVPQSGNF